MMMSLMSLPTPKTSRVLGIDPGTARVGWGIVDFDNETGDKVAVAYGCIETHKDTATAGRLLEIKTELQQIIEEFKPSTASVEKLFFTNNQTTAMKVSEARGVILLTLVENNIEYTEFTPKQVKMNLVGYGHADKKQIQFMVQQILELDAIPKPDDAADGLALALCAE